MLTLVGLDIVPTVFVAFMVALLSSAVVIFTAKVRRKKSSQKVQERIPESVNYHFTRQCNYECGFCFHTAKTSFVLPIDEAKRGLKMLKEAGWC